MYLVVFGCVWLYSIIFSCIQLYLVVFSCIQLYLVVFGCIQLILAVEHCPKGSESPEGVAVVQKGHIEAPAEMRGGAEIVATSVQR